MAELKNASGVIVFSGTGVGFGGALTRTITAAEVAARWDGGTGGAAIELYEGPRFIVAPAIVPTWDLDSVAGGFQFLAYLPGAATADVANNGESVTLYTYLATDWTIGTYQAVDTVDPAALLPVALLPGAALYVFYNGNAPPTSGSATVSLL